VTCTNQLFNVVWTVQTPFCSLNISELLQTFNTLTWIVNYHIEIFAYITVSHVTALSALVAVAVPFIFNYNLLCFHRRQNNTDAFSTIVSLRGNIIRTAPCCVVYNSCAQQYAHKCVLFLNLSVVSFALVFVCLSAGVACILCVFVIV